MRATQPSPLGRLIVALALTAAQAIDSIGAEGLGPEVEPGASDKIDSAGENIKGPATGPGVEADWRDNHLYMEEQRRFARQRALEMAMQGRNGIGTPGPVIAVADAFYGFILDGTPPTAPTLAGWPTDALVRELSNRVS